MIKIFFNLKSLIILFTLMFTGQFIFSDTNVSENKIEVSTQPAVMVSTDTIKLSSQPVPVISTDTINISSQPVVSVSSDSMKVLPEIVISSTNTVNVSSQSVIKVITNAVSVSTKAVAFSIENVKIPFQPDYSKKERWALLPQDNSKYKVDVFYVYPTIFGGQGYKLMDVSDLDLQKKAKNQAVFNTGIFEGQANIYAPLYRQAPIEMLKLDLKDNEQLLITGVVDVEQAFDYYLKNYNNGRPFILAGFSQGSIAVLEIMKNKFYDKQLQDKLVAAYIIGFSVTQDDLIKYPWLKMAQKADDIGVIISYNTQVANNGYSYLLHKDAKAINPITWKTDNKKSKEKQYKGALIYDTETGTIVGVETPFKTAYLEQETNALVVDVDKTKYLANKSIFPEGVLHMYDYMFFYNNLRENVPERISNYFKKHK